MRPGCSELTESQNGREKNPPEAILKESIRRRPYPANRNDHQMNNQASIQRERIDKITAALRRQGK
jgi:hypothetical protein